MGALAPTCFFFFLRQKRRGQNAPAASKHPQPRRRRGRRRARGNRDDQPAPGEPTSQTPTRKEEAKSPHKDRNEPAGGATKEREPRTGPDHHQRRAARNRHNNAAADEREGHAQRTTTRRPENNQQEKRTTNTASTPKQKTQEQRARNGATPELRGIRQAQGCYCTAKTASALALCRGTRAIMISPVRELGRTSAAAPTFGGGVLFSLRGH